MQRKAKLAPSYLIDEVIEHHALEYMRGRMVSGQDKALAYHATALQVLASESRMARMLMGMAVVDVLIENPKTYWSVVVESSEQPGVHFLWLVYPVVNERVSDDDLETAVGHELKTYIYVAMSKFPNAQTVFGIAIPNAESARTSRAFQMAVRNVWTDEMQKEAELLGLTRGIFSHVETTTRVAVHAI